MCKLSITNESKSFLLTTCKWAKFLAISGFVFLGILVLIALFIGFAGFPMGGMPTNDFDGMKYMIMLLYLFLAVLYFFPTLYLYRFSTLVKQGIENIN